MRSNAEIALKYSQKHFEGGARKHTDVLAVAEKYLRFLNENTSQAKTEPEPQRIVVSLAPLDRALISQVLAAPKITRTVSENDLNG